MFLIFSVEKDLVFGFDIEWKVTYQTGVYLKTAVLQLCEDDKKGFVFHLTHMNGTFIV